MGPNFSGTVNKNYQHFQRSQLRNTNFPIENSVRPQPTMLLPPHSKVKPEAVNAVASF
jgi:hypothetical protein